MITHEQIPTIHPLGRNLLILTWAGCLLGVIMFVLRIYVNAYINKRWTFDFWFAIPTFITALAMSIMMSKSVYYGLGTHQDILMAMDPDGDLAEKAIFYRWMVSLCCLLSILFGKLAIICYLLIIAGQTAKQVPHRKWSMYGLGITHVFLTLLMIPLLWTQCIPAAKSWDNRIPGTCPGRMRYQNYAYFWGSFETVVDIALAIYPALLFRKLNMRIVVKVGLIILFSMGIFAAVTCAVKVYYIYMITEASDRTYGLGLLGLWFVVEVWLVFIASCLPTVKPVFKRFYTTTPPVSVFDRPVDSVDLTNMYQSQVTSKSKYLPREAGLPLTGIKITEEVRVTVQKEWRYDFYVAARDFFTIK